MKVPTDERFIKIALGVLKCDPDYIGGDYSNHDYMCPFCSVQSDHDRLADFERHETDCIYQMALDLTRPVETKEGGGRGGCLT